jgi:nitroreductase
VSDRDFVGSAYLEQLLGQRHMCRDFESTGLESGFAEQLCAAAMGAPAAGNTAGIDLLVLEGESETSRYWNVSLPPGPRRDAFAWPGLLCAPLLVILVVDPTAYVQRYALGDKAHTGLGESSADWPVPYWWFDAGAAAMAMLMTAEAAGLGALLFGQFDREPGISSEFGIPSGRRSAATLAFGHPRSGGRNRSQSATRGRPTLEEHLHRGNW